MNRSMQKFEACAFVLNLYTWSKQDGGVLPWQQNKQKVAYAKRFPFVELLSVCSNLDKSELNDPC